jgi:hypothetical protein
LSASPVLIDGGHVAQRAVPAGFGSSHRRGVAVAANTTRHAILATSRALPQHQRVTRLATNRGLRWMRSTSAFALVACLSAGTTQPHLSGTGTPILFVGNSLTYVNDVPGIVQAFAAARGDSLAVETVAFPDYALIDHWNAGSARGTARGAIAAAKWKFVVLQQGPSSVAVNRDTLRLSAKLFAPGIARSGGVPALFSAWPTSDRLQDFPAAIQSYTLAASDVSGVLLPVASAWLAAWQRSPTLALYSDGLHASATGSYLSALAIYAVLVHKTPIGLPSSLTLRSGARVVFDSMTAATLQAAAASVTGW